MISASQPRPPSPLEAALSGLPGDTPLLTEVRQAAQAMPQAAFTHILPDTPHEIAAQFETWRRENVPALEPLLLLMPVSSESCLMAAVLASVPSPLSFHNQHHTREVVFLATQLSQNLDESAREELFIAACIHDFAHDGKGNRRGAVHTPMRLERRALDCAYPYLKAAGLRENSWKRISAMVLATDVSKDDSDATSPAEYLRAALKNQAMTDCPQELTLLFADSKLAHQAALLEDADLGTSAGMPYDHASRMTALIADETGVLAPTPQTLIGFLDHICHGAFLTQEAAAMFGDNIGMLRSQAAAETADTIYNWS